MNDPLPITRLSGTLRNVSINGVDYAVGNLRCGCAEATVTLAPDERDPKDAITVTINCPKHGIISAVATRTTGVTFALDVVDTHGVFITAIERHNKDHRIAWGMHWGKH